MLWVIRAKIFTLEMEKKKWEILDTVGGLRTNVKRYAKEEVFEKREIKYVEIENAFEMEKCSSKNLHVEIGKVAHWN